MAKKKLKLPIKIIVGLLIGLGAWSLINIIRLSAILGLEKIGIVNEITQYSIIGGLSIIILALLGYRFRESIKRMTR